MIYEDFMRYTGEEGFITPQLHGWSLNGVLYTSQAMIVMHDNNALPEGQIDKWKDLFARCFKEPGLLTRTPDHHRDQQAHDDMVGLAAVSWLFGFPFAKQMLKYGKRTTKFGPFRFKYVYNNVVPDTLLIPEDRVDRPISKLERLALKLWGKPGHVFNTVSWIGRMPSVIAHLHYCAGLRPNFLLRLIHALDIAYSAYHGEWMLAWLLVRTLDNRSWMGTLASKYYYKKLYEKFPNGLKDLEYLEQSTEHPITKYWVK